LRRGLVRAADAEDKGVAAAAALEDDPKLLKKIAKKRRVAYQVLAEREQRADRLKDMTAEMAMQKVISHSKVRRYGLTVSTLVLKMPTESKTTLSSCTPFKPVLRRRTLQRHGFSA
jgi:hypothetical protein